MNFMMTLQTLNAVKAQYQKQKTKFMLVAVTVARPLI